VITFKMTDLVWQAPMLALAATGLLLVLGEAFAGGRTRQFLAKLTVVGGALALVGAVACWRAVGDHERALMSGMLVADRFGYFIIALVAGITAMTALTSDTYLREHRIESGEYYAVMVLSASGMAILAMAANLVTVFLGVETMSIGAYVLIATRRRSERSAEAAMKYFLMGAFATGFLLYGIALVYGAMGTTDLNTVWVRRDAMADSPTLILGMFFLVIAFGFKIAAFPFHMWTPDAYEGAPTPVTGFMAAGVKTAAFAAMIRLFGVTFGGEIFPYGTMGWASILAVLAAITMTVGNIAALRQASVKRMLAYSSISHAGYLLVGLVAMGVGAGGEAKAALLFYLAAYSITTVGAFAVVAYVGRYRDERLLVDDWAGLAANHPGAAFAMLMFLLSLGGMPPLGGFFGKFYVFKAAMQAHDDQLLWLVVVGVLNSVISIFYYLRIVTAMYFRTADADPPVTRSASVAFVFVACAVLILQMGLLPGMWLDFTS
jgi:NADH-quinone oxidoreductase subunit N